MLCGDICGKGVALLVLDEPMLFWGEGDVMVSFPLHEASLLWHRVDRVGPYQPGEQRSSECDVR